MSDAYPRLRLGIGPESDEEVADASVSDFVLDQFLPGERQVLAAVLERCADVVTQWQAGVPVEQLMGRHNGFQAETLEEGPDGVPPSAPGDPQN